MLRLIFNPFSRTTGIQVLLTSITKRRLAGLALGLSVAGFADVIAAQAADPAFCRQYARTALDQVHAGLAEPHCAVNLQGERWSSEFSVHFEWCLGVSDTVAERAARARYLRSCR